MVFYIRSGKEVKDTWKQHPEPNIRAPKGWKWVVQKPTQLKT